MEGIYKGPWDADNYPNAEDSRSLEMEFVWMLLEVWRSVIWNEVIPAPASHLLAFFPQSRGASVQSKKTPSEEEFETIKLISNGAYGWDF